MVAKLITDSLMWNEMIWCAPTGTFAETVLMTVNTKVSMSLVT